MTRRGRWLLQPAEPSASCHDDHADSALVLAGPRRSAQGCFWRGSYTLSEKNTVLLCSTRRPVPFAAESDQPEAKMFQTQSDLSRQKSSKPKPCFTKLFVI